MSDQSYRSGLLQDAVLRDLGSLLEVPFDLLVGGLLPLTDETKVNEIWSKLEADEIIQANCWKSFPEPPSKLTSKEKGTFAPLSEIINGIMPDVTLSYISDPDSTPASVRMNTSQPDGFLKLIKTKTPETGQKGNKMSWLDIAIPFEFKMKKKDRLDNERKIIWNLHNIMREDPCHRFACGITIEDEDLRVWLCNRAYFAVTEPINFCTDLGRVISLFYSLGSASEAQLGWDPTIECISEKTYVITIKGMKYTTQKELAMFGADCAIGRGTRVWKAMDEKGNTIVVKDGWRDSDCMAEGDIMKMVLDAIEKKNPREVDEAKKYFVGIKGYEDVMTDGRPDRTLGLSNDSGGLPKGCKWKKVDPTYVSALPAHSLRAHKSSIGLPDPGDTLQCAPCEKSKNAPIPCKVHNRTVFSDLGTTIQDMDSLQDIISCLADVCKALRYMHLAGWVHRDFSIGNGLWVSELRTGKLMDLEYAKRVDSTESRDICTGTLNFMACEVLSMKYIFHPRTHIDPPAFRMNFLHDLESVFWSLAWVLCRHTNSNNPTSDVDRQLKEFEELFPGTYGERSDFFKMNVPNTSARLAECYGKVAWCLNDISDVILKSFTKAEKSYPLIKLDNDIMKSTHEKITSNFSKALDLCHDIWLTSLYDLKRKRTEDGDNLPILKKKSNCRRADSLE